jgi:hypothetical protein
MAFEYIYGRREVKLLSRDYSQSHVSRTLYRNLEVDNAADSLSGVPDLPAAERSTLIRICRCGGDVRAKACGLHTAWDRG